MKRIAVCGVGLMLCALCTISLLPAAPPATDYYRDVEAIYQRASNMVLDRRYEEAIELFSKINAINPYIAEIHGNLGYLYESVGNPELAINEYRTALEIDPNYADALNNLGYLLARHDNNPSEAVDLCRRAVFLDADNPSYRDSYGYALLTAGDIAEAFAQFERALFYDKDTGSTYYHLGLIYYRKGELEKARQQFSRAVSFRDCPAMAYLRLSQTLVEMGRLAEAIETMQKARWTAEKGWLSPASRLELETHLECFLRMGLLQGLVEVEYAGTGRGTDDLALLPMNELPPDTRLFIERGPLDNYFMNASGLVACRLHGYNPMAAVLRDRVRSRRGPYLERKGRLLSRAVQLALTRLELEEDGIPPASGMIDIAALQKDGLLPENFGEYFAFILEDTGDVSFTVSEGALASVTIPPGLEIKTITEVKRQLEETEGPAGETVEMPTPFDDYYAAEGDVESPPAVDYTQLIQAPGLVPVSPLLEKGWAIRQSIEAAGQKTETYYAVVGEEDGFWRMEYQGPALFALASTYPDIEDMLMGLVVDKTSGEVTRAVLGAPGAEGKLISIALLPDVPEVETPEPREEKVTIALGTFEAHRFATPHGSTWSGLEGELENVLLKSETGGQAFELAERPAWSTAEIDGLELQVSVRRYTNGMEYHIADNEIIAAFFPLGKAGETNQGIFKLGTTASTQNIVGLTTEAHAQLRW